MKLAFSLLILFSVPAAVSATDCSSECPSGEVIASFSNGDQEDDISCMCLQEASMEETVLEERNVEEDVAFNQSELEAQGHVEVEPVPEPE